MARRGLASGGYAVIAAAIFAAGGCASAEDAPTDVDEGALIGGAPASAEQFPSTLYLKHGCTAAKVAARHLLTAAHCVLDPSTLDLTYGPGKPLSLTREPAEGFAEVAVAKVHVGPGWVTACNEAYCASSQVTARLDAADIAVIELEADLADVPSTPIDTTPLLPGDRVTVIGFGCTEGATSEDRRETITLKFAETSVIDGRGALHDGSPVDTAILPQVSGIYALTPGPARRRSAGGLCPGDSGGPLYRTLDGTARRVFVVGVNANYTLRPGEADLAGIPVTNWHTRVDDTSRHGVAEWLRAVGALP